MKNKSNMKTKPQNLKLIFLLWGVFFSANLAFAQYGRTFKIEGDNLYIYDEEGNLLKQSNSGVIDAQELITYGTFDLKKNRITVKNAEKITIDLKNIENLTRVDRIYGGTLTWNETEKKIEIGSAGSVFIDYYTQDPNSRTETIWSLGIHVNYYGVLQYQGGDAPSEIIVTGEEDLEKEIYLPDGKFPGLRWFNGDGQSLENIIPDGTTRVSLKKLKETGFTHFKVRLRDGTFNELDSGIGGGESWIEFKVIFLPSCYTVSLSAQPDEGGSVQGAGTFNENSQVTVSATPNNGYKFVKWTENGVQVSTSASYQFTLTKDRNLVALFEELPKLVVDPTSISASAEGKEATVTVTSNQNWKRNFQ